MATLALRVVADGEAGQQRAGFSYSAGCAAHGGLC